MNFELVEIKPLFPKGSAKMIDSSEESKCSMARVCVFLKSARGIMGALGKMMITSAALICAITNCVNSADQNPQ